MTLDFRMIDSYLQRFILHIEGDCFLRDEYKKNLDALDKELSKALETHDSRCIPRLVLRSLMSPRIEVRSDIERAGFWFLRNFKTSDGLSLHGKKKVYPSAELVLWFLDNRKKIEPFPLFDAYARSEYGKAYMELIWLLRQRRKSRWKKFAEIIMAKGLRLFSKKEYGGSDKFPTESHNRSTSLCKNCSFDLTGFDFYLATPPVKCPKCHNDITNQVNVYDFRSQKIKEIESLSIASSKLSGTSAVEPHIDTLKTPELDQKKDDIVIVNVADDSVLASVIRSLDTPDYLEQKKAAIFLGELGDARAVGPLLAVLSYGIYEVQIAAVNAIKQIGTPAIPRLITALRDSSLSSRERKGAAHVLGEMGVSAMKPLIAILKDEEKEVREWAIEALGEIKDIRAVEPLLTALKDKHEDVCNAAVKALKNIGGLDETLWLKMPRKGSTLFEKIAKKHGIQLQNSVCKVNINITASDVARNACAFDVPTFYAFNNEVIVVLKTRFIPLDKTPLLHDAIESGKMKIITRFKALTTYPIIGIKFEIPCGSELYRAEAIPDLTDSDIRECLDMLSAQGTGKLFFFHGEPLKEVGSGIFTIPSLQDLSNHLSIAASHYFAIDQSNLNYNCAMNEYIATTPL